MTASLTLVGRVVTPPAAVFYESGAVRVTLSLAITRKRFAAADDLYHLELWGKSAQLAYDVVRHALIGVIGDLRFHGGQPWVLVDRLELLGESCSASTPADYAINTAGSPTDAEVA
jgi:single-strand DNA-binding protein